MFGDKQRGHVINALKEFILDKSEEKRGLDEIREKAAKQTKRTQSYNEQYVNNKRKIACEYAEGDFVVIRNFEATGGKLVPAYRGPYRIVKKLRNDRYVIADIEGHQMSQKPYRVRERLRT